MPLAFFGEQRNGTQFGSHVGLQPPRKESETIRMTATHSSTKNNKRDKRNNDSDESNVMMTTKQKLSKQRMNVRDAIHDSSHDGSHGDGDHVQDYGDNDDNDDDDDESEDSSFQQGHNDNDTDESSQASDESPHDDNKFKDDSSVASSLSSIPLRQLKVEMAKKKSQKRPNNSNSSDPPQPATKRTKLHNGAVSTVVAAKDATEKESSDTKQSGAKNNKDDEGETTTDDSEEEEAACCLCHCGVDFSDRALFFPKDRKQELEEEDDDYYFQLEDPYLAQDLYDRNNALVYCDSCNRLYHQKCHFAPILVIPRGDWNCLVCTLQQHKNGSIANGSKKRKSSPSKTNMTGKDEQLWRKFTTEAVCKGIFTSPPTPSTRTLEKEWELATALPKAQLWNQQFKQLRTFLKSQASNIRMATTALETLTSTKRNRAHFTTSGKKSQELAQTLVRLATGKWKIRTALQSLDDLRLNNNPLHTSLIDWYKAYPKHGNHVFPHGLELYRDHRRTTPRTREVQCLPVATIPQSPRATSAVPKEIAILSPVRQKQTKGKMLALPTSPRSVAPKSSKANSSAKPITSPKQDAKPTNMESGSDDDSGISLDDLQCCICLVGDASDENDVLLCDGQGCCRAFHMRCVYPNVKPEDIEDEEEDWFCPICSTLSEFIAETQLACVDEDWEHRRETEKYKHLESSSLHSWGMVQEVFPEAEWEYNTSLKLKVGKQNEDTAKVLRHYLGDGFGGEERIQMPVGSDSEDENDYSLFDEESFVERRRKEREETRADDEDDATESSRSSSATLVDMSSVELNIGKSELAALSEGTDEDSDSSSEGSGDSEDDEHGIRRKSRRLRNAAAKSEQSSFADLGADFDEGNIIEGKRQRKRVDYRKLNDALFGDLSAKERAEIDDKDDFKAS